MSIHVNPPDDVLDNLHAEGDDTLHDFEGREVDVEHDPEAVDLAPMLRQYISLTLEKRSLDNAAALVAKDRAVLEERLVEAMGAQGFQNVSLDGYCVARKRETYASLVPETKQQALDVLRALGLGELLTVNHSTLKARVKGWLKQGNLPEELVPFITTGEGYGLGVTKKPARK